MKYKPWGWVDVLKDGRIQAGVKRECKDGGSLLTADVTGGEELVTEEVKRVMAALDFVGGRVKLPCGSYYQDGFSFDNRSAITGVIPMRTYFIFLGDHDEIQALGMGRCV